MPKAIRKLWAGSLLHKTMLERDMGYGFVTLDFSVSNVSTLCVRMDGGLKRRT